MTLPEDKKEETVDDASKTVRFDTTQSDEKHDGTATPLVVKHKRAQRLLDVLLERV